MSYFHLFMQPEDIFEGLLCVPDPGDVKVNKLDQVLTL